MYNLNDVTDYPHVSKDEILKRVSQYQIFCFYCGKELPLGEVMLSPLRRVDKNPSFSVFKSKYGGILYHDFGTGETGNCFDFVTRLFNLSFYETLIRITQDFNLKLSYSKTIKHTPFRGYLTNVKESELEEKPPIKIKMRKFIETDLFYWKQYGISEKMLNYYKVVSVQALFYGDVIIARPGWMDPIFAYLFYKDEKVMYKIYRPLTQKGRKWFTTTNKSVLQGWDQMPAKGDLLIITKSLKDVMVLRSLGFNSLAMQSEISTIKDSVMDELYARFDTIYLLQDFDLAGVSGTNKMRKRFKKIRYFFIQDFKTRNNGLKDISDYRKAHGEEKTKELLNKFIYGIK